MPEEKSPPRPWALIVSIIAGVGKMMALEALIL